MRKQAFLVAFVAVAGCFPSAVVRTGARYPALPENCPVEFVNSTADLKADQYEVLGNVTLSGGSGEITDAVKQELQPQVCEWGGTTVAPAYSASAGLAPNQNTYSIYRKRDPSAPVVPLACTGKFANGDGATLSFEAGGKTTMAFGGNVAECSATSRGGQQVTMTCNGLAQDGTFAADCTRVSFGGMDYNKTE